MRYLVTGASGHLGSFLTQLLLSHGEQVACVVRKQSNLWRLHGILDQVQLIHSDIADYGTLHKEVATFAPDVVVHLAWDGITADKRNDPAQISQNVVGTLNLAKVAHSAGCKTWIGIGSQAEYGPYNVPLREDLPPHPVTTYGISKYCSGLLTQKMCELTGVRFVWVRLLATYGPKDDKRHLIPSVICQLLSQKRPSLTLGEQQWDYLYVEDAAEALYQLAHKNEATGIFNLGSGQAYVVRDIVESIRDMIDSSLPLGFGDVPYRPDQIMRLLGDISHLSSTIDWKPTTSLHRGLERTILWYRSQIAATHMD